MLFYNWTADNLQISDCYKSEVVQACWICTTIQGGTPETKPGLTCSVGIHQSQSQRFFKSLKLCWSGFSEIPWLRSEQSWKHSSFNRLFQATSALQDRQTFGGEVRALAHPSYALYINFSKFSKYCRRRTSLSWLLLCPSSLSAVVHWLTSWSGFNVWAARLLIIPTHFTKHGGRKELPDGIVFK